MYQTFMKFAGEVNLDDMQHILKDKVTESNRPQATCVLTFGFPGLAVVAMAVM